MRCLFEVYINKVIDKESGDCNETIAITDISDIISKEIIPQLDPKNLYQYIEGLIKPPKGESYETVFDMRKAIIKEKMSFFIKQDEYKTLAKEDERRLKEGDEEIRKRQYTGVIFDPSEFWLYISKEGIIHFILDTYDEKLKEFNSDKSNESTHSLQDDFSHAKTNLLKLKQLFQIVESNFLKGRVDNSFLDQYRNLI